MPETTPISAMGNCEDLADAIERGEHLEAPSHE